MDIMFSDPEKNIEALNPKAGSSLADFGSGAGHHAIAALKALGPAGTVYAIDIQKDSLQSLKREAQKQGLENLEVIWGDIETPKGSRLAEGAVEYVLISNLMFQVNNHASVVAEAMRVLRPGGLLFLVDWADSFGGIGPSRDVVFDKEKAKALFSGAGFVLEREVATGSHHYGIIFSKPL